MMQVAYGAVATATFTIQNNLGPVNVGTWTARADIEKFDDRSTWATVLALSGGAIANGGPAGTIGVTISGSQATALGVSFGAPTPNRNGRLSVYVNQGGGEVLFAQVPVQFLAQGSEVQPYTSTLEVNSLTVEVSALAGAVYTPATSTSTGLMPASDKSTRNRIGPPSASSAANTAAILAAAATQGGGGVAINLSPGDWVIDPDQLALGPCQGLVLEGAGCSRLSGRGTRLICNAGSGGYILSLRSTYKLALRNLTIVYTDGRFQGDVIDFDGHALLSDSFSHVLENIIIDGSWYGTPTVPNAPVPSSGGLPAVTLSGAGATIPFRGVVKIDPGGATFSYSETGGGALGDNEIQPASIAPNGTGDANWIATGVAIPAGGSWSVPAGRNSTGITINFSVGAYVAGSTYKFGLGARRGINGVAWYCSQVTNINIYGVYDAVYNGAVGTWIQTVTTGHLGRYAVEGANIDGGYINVIPEPGGSANGQGGVWCHNCPEVTIHLWRADQLTNGPWVLLDGGGSRTHYTVLGTFETTTGAAIKWRNGVDTLAVSGRYTSPKILDASDASGTNGTMFLAGASFDGGAANIFTGSNIQRLCGSMVSSGGGYHRFEDGVYFHQGSSHSGDMDFAPSGQATGRIINLRALGRPVSPTYGTFSAAPTVDWSVSPLADGTLGANTTFAFTAPAGSNAALGLLLTIRPHATNAYTIAFPATVDWYNGVAPSAPTPGGAPRYVWFDYTGSRYVGRY